MVERPQEVYKSMRQKSILPGTTPGATLPLAGLLLHSWGEEVMPRPAREMN